MSIRVARLALATLFATALAATTAFAQEPSAPSADASPAAFEVAAIRPSNPNPDPTNPLSMVPLVRPHPGGRVTATNVPLKMLIGMAFEMQDFRVSGGPPELMNAKFDITAKASWTPC